MAPEALDGWTPDKLDLMRKDVDEIKVTLAKMHSEEMRALRERVKELERRPRVLLLALGGPVVAAALTVVLTHAF